MLCGHASYEARNDPVTERLFTVRKLLVLLPSALLLVAAGAPSLKVLGGDAFTPGMWRLTPLDQDAQSRAPAGKAQCVTDPATLIYAGFTAGTSDCTHTVVEDLGDRATLTYVCKGQGTGRVELRKGGTDGFVVDSRGISGREPFEMRGEFKRTGDCR
jgi:hypothetical protein